MRAQIAFSAIALAATLAAAAIAQGDAVRLVDLDFQLGVAMPHYIDGLHRAAHAVVNNLAA